MVVGFGPKEMPVRMCNIVHKIEVMLLRVGEARQDDYSTSTAKMSPRKT